MIIDETTQSLQFFVLPYFKQQYNRNEYNIILTFVMCAAYQKCVYSDKKSLT